MDRIDAMKVFVTALDEGSLAGASRVLRRSPAAVSRSIAALEAHVGVELLHRTTRSLRLSEAGQRYAAACRRILVELEEADLSALGERSAPRGLLTISAPPIAGEEILRPVLDRFLLSQPDVTARLLLVDRSVNLPEEGVDIALRIGQLPDSSLIAIRVGSGIRRVVVGAPSYLDSGPAILSPADVEKHQIVALHNFGLDSWNFAPLVPGGSPRRVSFVPKLTVNTVPAALQSTIAGVGLTRLYSYHVAAAVRIGALRVLLADAEYPAVPAQLLTASGRANVPKVRAFLDFAAPLLRAEFKRLEVESLKLG